MPFRTTVRKVLLAFSILALLAFEIRSGVRLPVNDFVEYWAAARLALDGQNPYSQTEMFRLEQASEDLGSEKPLMMWNPPYALPFVLPFGFLSLTTARVVMALLAFAMIFLSAEWMWHFYGGDPQRRWIAWIATAAFAPVFA